MRLGTCRSQNYLYHRD